MHTWPEPPAKACTLSDATHRYFSLIDVDTQECRHSQHSMQKHAHITNICYGYTCKVKKTKAYYGFNDRETCDEQSDGRFIHRHRRGTQRHTIEIPSLAKERTQKTNKISISDTNQR